MTGKLVGLAHIGIYTADMDTSIAFYKRLGFELDTINTLPGAELGFMSLGTCLIELIQPADLKRLDGLVGGVIAHIAIECRGIEGVVGRLKGEGIIKQDEIIKTSDLILDGVKNIFFVGPSGENIELFDYYKRD